MFNKLYAIVTAKAGNGGNGSKATSIHNKSLIYHGGNGGHGGNIIFQQSSTVLINNDFISNKIVGNNGQDGQPGKKDGKNGKDIVVPLSIKTRIFTKFDEYITEINDENTSFVIKGQRGGYGSRITKSTKFTSANQGKTSKSQVLKLVSVLPEGDFYIFNSINFDKIKSFLLQKWGYKTSINKIITVLQKDNKHIYIITYCNENTLCMLSDYKDSIKSVFLYTTDFENKYVRKIQDKYSAKINLEI